jgi:hypothetical protein
MRLAPLRNNASSASEIRALIRPDFNMRGEAAI